MIPWGVIEALRVYQGSCETSRRKFMRCAYQTVFLSGLISIFEVDHLLVPIGIRKSFLDAKLAFL